MSWSTGDFTGDGTVDINDLTIVLANYGKTTGSSAAGMSAVPEPSSMMLLATVGLAAAAWAMGAAGAGRKRPGMSADSGWVFAVCCFVSATSSLQLVER